MVVVEVVLGAFADFLVGWEEVVVFGGEDEQLVDLETNLGGQTEERRVARDRSFTGEFGGQGKYIG